MPFGSVLLRPGINTEFTATLNEAGYSTSQLIRWMQGLAQKIGGWVRYYPFNLTGVPRCLHAWLDLNANKYLGIGTTTQLSIVLNSALTDITPQTKTTDFSPNFSTVINTATVTIVDSNVTNPTAFDAIFFNTPVSVGGIILSGLYQISLVLGTHQYQIVAATNATSTVNNAGAVPVFTTTSGSATVSVAFTAHGLSAGSTINFPISTTVGGVSILGTYPAVSITSANAFTIQVSSLASSGTSGSMNSGNCELVYYIALGPVASSTGYSVGTYSSGAYSTGVTITPQTGTEITATDWSLDNWGQTLLANPAGGGIYQWTPGAGFQNAQLIATAPVTVNDIFVAMPAQILVALGAASPQNIGTNADPLRVQWSDQLNFNTWTPTTTNQAGSFRIPTGSKIIGGFQGPQFAMLWTDIDLWAMQYLGFPLVFGFNKIGAGCGLIARHAMAQVGQGVFWMSLSNFFVLSGGGATPIPCSVWDAVFQDLDTSNLDQIWAWPSSTFNEVWWFYPSLSGGTGQCDSYVKLNTVENSWDYGTLPRSAGIDQSVLGTPIAATPTGLIFQHEMGENGDDSPISWSFRSGFWTIADGNNVAFVDWYLPDMIWGLFDQTQTTQISITFYSRFYPGGTETTYGPYVVNSSTPYINPRIRGREMAIQIAGSDVNSFVRVGRNRFRFAPDGRNP